MAIQALDAVVVDELVAICGADHVFTGKSALFNRARVPAPFPLHRWEEHVPQAVVLPTSAEQISEVVRLANRARVPVVPRAGATGLSDGAVPLRGGILVDIMLMNKVLEIDVEDRTVTVQPGVNMMRLSEQPQPLGYIYPDGPASYPCSLVGGRIGTNGFSLLASRYGHTRDLVLSMEVVLPTGEIIRVGEGGGRKIRKSSSGYAMKQLFMGHQGTLGIVTEATLELVPRAEAEFAAFFSFGSYLDAWRATGEMARSGLATLAGVVLFDEQKVAYLRRDDEAWIPAPDWVKGIAACAAYGQKDETRAAAKHLMRIAKANDWSYAGDEISMGDWASRHDRYAIPLHGRTRSGQAVLMSWHCEDAAINYSKLPEVRDRWHRIVDGLRERFDTFDDWGMFSYTNGSFRPGGDYLVEIDVGIWEQRYDEAMWSAWVDAKREIARAAIEVGGSMTSCHGSCREGEVDLLPLELGGGFELMKKLKRTIDPNNIMNPGKYLLDQAYEEDEA